MPESEIADRSQEPLVLDPKLKQLRKLVSQMDGTAWELWCQHNADPAAQTAAFESGRHLGFAHGPEPEDEAPALWWTEWVLYARGRGVDEHDLCLAESFQRGWWQGRDMVRGLRS